MERVSCSFRLSHLPSLPLPSHLPPSPLSSPIPLISLPLPSFRFDYSFDEAATNEMIYQ